MKASLKVIMLNPVFPFYFASQERINAKIAELKAAEAKLTPDQRKSALLKVFFSNIP